MKVQRRMRRLLTSLKVFSVASALLISQMGTVAYADSPQHITGVVTDQNNTPLPNISVLARISGSTTDATAPVPTATDGTYDLLVPQGTYDILFGPPTASSNLGPAIVRSVVVQDSQAVNVQLTSVQRSFSGGVIDNNGNPIPNLQVRISSSLSGQFYRAFTNSEGSFTITAPAGYYDTTNFGGLTSSVTLGGYPLASPSIGGLGGANALSVDTMSSNVTQDFTLHFVKLTITVKDDSGNPVSGQRVHTRFGGGSVIVNSGNSSYSLANNGNNYGGLTGADGTYTALISKGAIYPSGTICLSSTNLLNCDVASNSITATASGDLNLLFQGNPPVQVVAPSAPTGLSAQSPTNFPHLTWDVASNATSYNIYRNGAPIGSSTTNSYIDTTATTGENSYHITALNGTNESDPSNTLTVTVDTTAPAVTNVQQVWNVAKQRTEITLTFSEPVTGLPQGWNGSGTTFTKAFYNTNPATVTFVDAVGNAGSTIVTPTGNPNPPTPPDDGLDPTVTNVQQVWNVAEQRTEITLTFSEAVFSLPQGWYGSGTSYTKSFYNTNPATVTFVDAQGNPGSMTVTPIGPQ